jgi:hypothetical protein
VHETGQQRRIAVERREPPRDHVTQRGDLHAVFPQRVERSFEMFELGRLLELLHDERERCRAHDVETDACDSLAQVGDLAARRVQRGGVRHVHEFAGQHRFGADDAHDDVVGHVVVRQCLLELEHDVRNGRQLDLPL